MSVDTRGGWKQKILMWEFTDLILNRFDPQKILTDKRNLTEEQIEFWYKEKKWELLDPNDKYSEPPSVRLEHIRGKNETEIESRTLCVKWDDEAEERFYQRDFTSDGIPIVREKEVYWSSWSFRTFEERERFLNWLPNHYKGPITIG